ncbi:MAG: baseplate J/gp47 family protein [Ruminiclostridium sp.]|nr:baseplate J/gp47 family protein [Ruminiclostridium sp.]
MIKLPNLDDQRYVDIVEAAKRRIPVLYSEWTNLNEHDPGITILELFAWLKEMQQYYLNRISDRSRENMLLLLGIERLPAAPSETLISFRGEAPERLPQGVSLYTADGTEFVSTEAYRAAPFRLGRVLVENEGAYADVTEPARYSETAFYPFGSRLDSVGRCLYIEVSEIDGDRFFDGAELLFDIFDRLPVPRNAPVGDSPPPREIVWEYSTAQGFAACDVLSDDTYALSFGGGVTLKIGRDMAPFGTGELPRGLWIRARLAESGCEDMPQICRIYCGALRLTQKSRLVAADDMVLEGTFVGVDGMLAARGACFMFVRDEHGWLLNESAVIVKTDTGAVFGVSGLTADTVCGGRLEVRAVRCEESFVRNGMFFSSDGLPCQEFAFDPGGAVLCEELRVMVKDRKSDEFPRWNEYRYIVSLSLAGAYDRCFTYDEERHVLMFGDNEHGEVPPSGNKNIMVFSCSVTSGSSGNVPAGNFKELTVSGRSYPIGRAADSTGGRDREKIAHSLGRLRKRINACGRTVTVGDYRRAALNTPGLRIADAKAIPFFDSALPPELFEVSESKAPNTVTVVVLPYSTERFPMPDKRFLSAVKDHLEKYRLITTRVLVTAPIYVQADVSAEVVCLTQEVEQASCRIEAALREMFSVMGSDGRKRFGEPISEADIIGCICNVEGILSVKRLRVKVGDKRCGRDRYGRIVIPPNAVTYCGDVNVRVADL